MLSWSGKWGSLRGWGQPGPRDTPGPVWHVTWREAGAEGVGAVCRGGGQLHSAVLGPLMPLRLNGAHQGPEGLQLGPLQAKDGTRPRDQGRAEPRGTWQAGGTGAPGRPARRRRESCPGGGAGKPAAGAIWGRQEGTGEAGGGAAPKWTAVCSAIRPTPAGKPPHLGRCLKSHRGAGRAVRVTGRGVGRAPALPPELWPAEPLARGSQALGRGGRRPPPRPHGSSKPRGLHWPCLAGRRGSHVTPPVRTAKRTLVAGPAEGHRRVTVARGEAGAPSSAWQAWRGRDQHSEGRQSVPGTRRLRETRR